MNKLSFLFLIPQTHSGSVWRVTWAHPEFGQVLASCSFDRTAAVWEEIVGESNDKLRGQSHWVRYFMVFGKCGGMSIQGALGFPRTLQALHKVLPLPSMFTSFIVLSPRFSIYLIFFLGLKWYLRVPMALFNFNGESRVFALS